MAGFGSVYLKCGEQPRYFNFGRPDNPVLAITAQGVIASQPMLKEGLYATFQAILTTAAAETMTASIQGTNDPNTGQGFSVVGNNAPGFVITTTTGSSSTTSSGQFFAAMNGATVVAAGVPYGTTLTYISANSAILSANATATSPGTPANIFAQNWVATALGTITLNGAVNASDGFAVVASWRWVRVNVTTLTGTTFSLQFIAGF